MKVLPLSKMLTYMYLYIPFSHQELSFFKYIFAQAVLSSLYTSSPIFFSHCACSSKEPDQTATVMLRSLCGETALYPHGVSCTPHYRFFILILPYYYCYSNAHDIGKFFECFLYIMDGLTLLDSPMRYFFMSLFL